MHPPEHTGDRKATIRMLLALVFAIVAVATSLTVTPPATADTTYTAVAPWNGKKVYLSPAYHTATAGARGECNSPYSTPRTERTMGRIVALAAANGGSNNFRTRNYHVRIGDSDPTTNKNSSNAWGAHIHIPMHSNARTQPGGCTGTGTSGNGTVQIYVSTNGNALAASLRDRLSTVTPGTSDQSCHVSSSCTKYSCLVELCSTSAVASYSETEFHTWNRGTAFLYDRADWAWRFGWAVDAHLGYP